MGQHYKIVNIDKEELLEPRRLDNGLQLLHWSYSNTYTNFALMNMVAGPWKGDRVFVVGDYADLEEPDEPCHKALKKILEEKRIKNLHCYAESAYKDVSKNADKTDHHYKYLYNHALKTVIELDKCPIEWVFDDGEVQTVAPLPLLIAMGNNRGGGDFYDDKHGYEYVGSWCDTVTSIEVTTEPISGTEDYTVFAPDFTECNPIIPYYTPLKKARKML